MLIFRSGIWDGEASRRGFWYLFPVTFHLETIKEVSYAILKALYMDCGKGKAVFQGGECSRPEEIHDMRDLGAFRVKVGSNTSVITRKMNVPVVPESSP